MSRGKRSALVLASGADAVVAVDGGRLRRSLVIGQLGRRMQSMFFMVVLQPEGAVELGAMPMDELEFPGLTGIGGGLRGDQQPGGGGVDGRGGAKGTQKEAQCLAAFGGELETSGLDLRELAQGRDDGGDPGGGEAFGDGPEFLLAIAWMEEVEPGEGDAQLCGGRGIELALGVGKEEDALFRRKARRHGGTKARRGGRGLRIAYCVLRNGAGEEEGGEEGAGGVGLVEQFVDSAAGEPGGAKKGVKIADSGGNAARGGVWPLPLAQLDKLPGMDAEKSHHGLE